ncbi:MAG: lactonase family protein [Bacteroidales bacterium]
MKTRKLMQVLLGLLFPAILTACDPGESGKSETPNRFYVGSSDGKIEYSIYLCELDPVAGALTVLDSFAGAVGPSYLAISPDGNSLYTVDNRSVDPEKKMQSVNAFHINRDDLSLEFLNSQASEGRGPCHVYAAEGYVFVANYNSGHAAAFAIKTDGQVGTSTSVVTGEGGGPNKGRQEGPHAHQVMLDPSGTFLLVPDLGTDKVMNYVFDRKTGELIPNPEQSWLEMPPGAGPRHLAFHPSGELVYVLGEMSATVTACSFDGESGVLSIINSASIVKDGFTGGKGAAAVRVHPNGNFIYASNRDDSDNLAVYRKKDDGGIELIQIVEDIPHWPRDFNITPDGKFLLVAGARANEVELFKIDTENGKLESTGIKISVPEPTCILFVD